MRTEPFMPIAELTDDMLLDTGKGVVRWGDLRVALAAEEAARLHDANECICPKCGIRHGGRSVADPGF